MLRCARNDGRFGQYVIARSPKGDVAIHLFIFGIVGSGGVFRNFRDCLAGSMVAAFDNIHKLLGSKGNQFAVCKGLGICLIGLIQNTLNVTKEAALGTEGKALGRGWQRLR